MSSYSIINKEINKYFTGKNKNIDICLYGYIKLNSDFRTGVSHITQEKLSKLTNIPIRTLQSSISRLRGSNLLLIKTKQVGQKKFNIYYFDVNPENFFFVDNLFFYVDIDPKEKGLLLLIKSLCFNNSNKTLYNRTKISELLNQDRSTVSKMIDKLINKNMLLENKGGFVLPANYFQLYSMDTRSGQNDENLNSYDKFVLDSILDICNDKGSIIFISNPYSLKLIFAHYPLLETDITNLDEEQLKSKYLPAVLKDRCLTLPSKIESLNYFLEVLNIKNVERETDSDSITL